MPRVVMGFDDDEDAFAAIADKFKEVKVDDDSPKSERGSLRRSASQDLATPKRAWGAQRGSKGLGVNNVYVPYEAPTGTQLWIRKFMKLIDGDIKEKIDTGTIPRDANSGSVVEALQKDQMQREKNLSRRLHEEAVYYTDRKAFNLQMSAVTAIHMIFIGMETDYGTATDVGQIIMVCNTMFLLVYIVELIFRFITKGVECFKDTLYYTDLIIGVCSLFERVLGTTQITRALPALRLMRFLKTLHSMGVINWSRTGQHLFATFFHLVKTLGWTLLVLVTVVWSAAAFSHKVIGDSGEWASHLDPQNAEAAFSRWDNIEYFGTFWMSFMTLLQVVTMSQWASEVARPVVKVYPALSFFFLFLILATAYGLLLCVISSFVHTCLCSSQRQKIMKDLQEKEVRAKVAHEVLALINRMDQDNDGQLDLAELEEAFANPEIKERLISVGVPANVDAKGFMHWLDRSCDGRISFEEFQEGLVIMDDEVLPRDYIKLFLWLNATAQRVTVMEKRMAAVNFLLFEVHHKFVDAVASIHAMKTDKDYKNFLSDIVKLARNPQAKKIREGRMMESEETRRLRELYVNPPPNPVVKESMAAIERLVQLPAHPSVRNPPQRPAGDEEVEVMPPTNEAPLLQGLPGSVPSLRAAATGRGSPERCGLPDKAPLVNEATKRAGREALAKRTAEEKAADQDPYSGLGAFETSKNGMALKMRMKELI